MLSTARAGYDLVLSVCDLPGICRRPSATRSAAPQPQHMALALELVAALRDSAFMEHAARAQLLLSQLVPPWFLSGRGGGGGGGDGDGLGGQPTTGQQLLYVTTASCQMSISKLTLLVYSLADGPQQPGPHGEGEGEDAAAGPSSALQQVLSGRCVHTARLYFGLAALCAADGGPAYGLPPALLAAARALSIFMGDGGDGRCTGAGAGGGGGGWGWEAAGDGVGTGRLYACVLLSVSMPILKWTPPAPPGMRAVCALALRVGRLALASLPPAATGPEAKLRTEAGGAASVVRCSSGGSAESSEGGQGGGSGDDSASGGTTGGSDASGRESCAVLRMSPYTAAAVAAPGGAGGGSGGGDGGGDDAAVRSPTGGTLTGTRPRRVLRQADAACLCLTALSAARGQLERRGGARDSAPWRADAAECWRLATAAVRHALPRADEDVPCELAGSLLWLWRETARERPNPEQQLFSDAPPPPLVAAALDAGLLPCLERLLRRTARAPDGPEAVFCRCVFGRVSRDNYVVMALLLAYGEPRQAAALVATLGKLARTTDPRVATAAWVPEQDSSQCLLRFVCWTLQAAATVHASQWILLQGAAGPSPDRGAGPSPDAGGSPSETAPAPGPTPAASSTPGAAGPRSGPTTAASSTSGAPGPTPAANSRPGAVVSPSLALRQLGDLVPLAFATVLPPLARLALPAVEEALRHLWAPAGHQPGAPAPPLALGRGSLGALAPVAAASLPPLAALRGVGGDAGLAAAEGASGSADASRAGWLSLLLEEVGAVELLSAALEMAAAGAWRPLAPPRPPPQMAAGQLQAGQEGPEEGQAGEHGEGPKEDKDGLWCMTWVMNACLAVAAVLGDLVTTAPPAGREESLGPGGAALGADAAAETGAAVTLSTSDAGGGLAPPRQSPPWRPGLLRAVAEQLRAAGAEGSGAAAEELVARLSVRGSGGQPGRDGTRGVEGGAAAAGDGEVRAAGVFSLGCTLPPYPTEARRLLRTCANPSCTNLNGDSEADLTLWECSGAAGPGGSGAAAGVYCCCPSCKGLEWLS
ncbi:hypothetical protein GPECTOR_157g93 [Gonium pectorale]|uniref:MYND-type domain-containing protein n=1 Tax=Gonium pectorale TaxID=33097 RepID=A0A150FYS2_GONPE|nr:hypothetical protein GPECTOR_157g93 [Gonium pectorale]|eukprot:KXZ42355.1 hypothetical protein GPECTOR_157g93 [Gonium pectorale]